METYYVDNDQLISLVKEQPVLWDKSIDHYKSRNSIASAWKEVCAKLHEDFQSLGHQDKDHFGRHVIKKWTNLKDCWWRSLKRRGDGMKPAVRPYRYYRELSFLKKNVQNNNLLTSLELQESESSGSDNFQPEIATTPAQIPDTVKHEPTLPQESKVTDRRKEPTTEDRHISFFKGILPALHSLNEDQILRFQIEVLRVLHQIKSPRTEDTFSLPSNF